MVTETEGIEKRRLTILICGAITVWFVSFAPGRAMSTGDDCLEPWVGTCVAEAKNCVDCGKYCSDLGENCVVEWSYCENEADSLCSKTPGKPIRNECTCMTDGGGGTDPGG